MTKRWRDGRDRLACNERGGAYRRLRAPRRIGGIVVFGGGLALYRDGNVVGGLGVSGDSSCADHNVAWRVRAALGLDKTPQKDAIIYDLNHDNKSASGFGHAKCAGHEADVASEIGAGVGGTTMGPRPK
jgi:Haem-degrading